MTTRRALSTVLLLLPGTAALREAFFQEGAAHAVCPSNVLPRSLQEFFDAKRRAIGIETDGYLGEGDAPPQASQCTKRDVCLLMKQLDLDFYQRARSGTISDIEFGTKPMTIERFTGDCTTMDRGYKLAPIKDADECKAAFKSKHGKALTLKEVDGTDLPLGCYADGPKTSNPVLFLNVNPDAKGSASSNRAMFCMQDRSLDEGQAAYYSPYKLKTSIPNAAMSTACSFGMYAFLARLRETQSPCAKILTYKRSSSYGSHTEVLAEIEEYRRNGNKEDALDLEQYLETVRAKYVLIDTIANDWCPSIWQEAVAAGSDGTCTVSRNLPSKAPAFVAKPVRQKSAPKTKPQRPVAPVAPVGGYRMDAKAKELGVKSEALNIAGNQKVIHKVNRLKQNVAQWSKEWDGHKQELAALFNDASTTAGSAESSPRSVSSAGSEAMGRNVKLSLLDTWCTGGSFQDANLQGILDATPDVPDEFFEMMKERTERPIHRLSD